MNNFVPNIFRKNNPDVKLPEFTLFIDEKKLGSLGHDWISAVGYLMALNLGKEGYALIFDDDETSLYMDYLNKIEINLFVMNNVNDSAKTYAAWQVLMCKGDHKKHDKKYCKEDRNCKDEVIFIGGENLRKYCDERNIYYKSKITKDKNNNDKLISSTNFAYEKNKDEDCRIPK